MGGFIHKTASTDVKKEWNNEVLTLTGISGKEYSFQIYPVGSPFPKTMKAVYIFTKKVGSNRHKVLYIGQSCEVGTRIANHEKLPQAKTLGMTNIGIYQLYKDQDLLPAETDLIRNYDCECNKQ